MVSPLDVRAPDIGPAIRAFGAGREMRRDADEDAYRQQQRNVLAEAGSRLATGDRAGARDTLYRGGRIEEGGKIANQINSQTLAQGKEMLGALAAGALFVDDDAAYDALVDDLGKEYGEDLSRFKGAQGRLLAKTKGISVKDRLNMMLKEREANKPTAMMQNAEYLAKLPPGDPRRDFMMKAGSTNINVNTGDNVGLSKPTINDVQSSAIKSQEQLARLNDIKAAFKPEYQTLPFRAGMKMTEIKAKLGRDLAPGERQGLTEFATFKRSSVNNVNKILNEMSGAAVSPQEALRIRASQPDAGDGIFDGDDPVSFEAKINATTSDLMRALARQHYVLRHGIPKNPWDVMQLDQVDDLINERGNTMLQELQAANPGANPADLQAQVKLQLQKEFGLGFEGAR